MEDVTIAIRLMLDRIYSQRQEIMEAFIAKYGCEPDECEQIIISDVDNVIRWFVRKKPTVGEE
jgi:hypothetical protein